MDNDPERLDKYGVQVSEARWVELMGDPRYMLVRGTKIKSFVVSTVWLGGYISASGRNSRMRFETMIFEELPSKYGPHNFLKRYPTIEEAIQGHDQACRLVRSGWKGDRANWVRNWIRIRSRSRE